MSCFDRYWSVHDMCGGKTGNGNRDPSVGWVAINTLTHTHTSLLLLVGAPDILLSKKAEKRERERDKEIELMSFVMCTFPQRSTMMTMYISHIFIRKSQ